MTIFLLNDVGELNRIPNLIDTSIGCLVVQQVQLLAHCWCQMQVVHYKHRIYHREYSVDDDYDEEVCWQFEYENDHANCCYDSGHEYWFDLVTGYAVNGDQMIARIQDKQSDDRRDQVVVVLLAGLPLKHRCSEQTDHQSHDQTYDHNDNVEEYEQHFNRFQ